MFVDFSKQISAKNYVCVCPFDQVAVQCVDQCEAAVYVHETFDPIEHGLDPLMVICQLMSMKYKVKNLILTTTCAQVLMHRKQMSPLGSLKIFLISVCHLVGHRIILNRS